MTAIFRPHETIRPPQFNKIGIPNKIERIRGLLFASLFALDTLGSIVLLGKLLVSQKLWVHASGVDVLGLLGLLNTVGVSLCGIVMCACVLLL